MKYADLLEILEENCGEFDYQTVRVIVDGEIIEAKELKEINGEYFLSCDEDD